MFWTLLQLQGTRPLAPFRTRQAMPASAALWSVADSPGTLAFCTAAEIVAAVAAGAPVRSIAQVTTGLGRVVVTRKATSFPDASPSVGFSYPVNPAGDHWAWRLINRIEPGLRPLAVDTTPEQAVAAGLVDGVLVTPLHAASWANDASLERHQLLAFETLPDIVLAMHRDVATDSPELYGALKALQAVVRSGAAHADIAAAKVADVLGTPDAPLSKPVVEALTFVARRGSVYGYPLLRHDPAGWALLGSNIDSAWTDAALQ